MKKKNIITIPFTVFKNKDKFGIPSLFHYKNKCTSHLCDECLEVNEI